MNALHVMPVGDHVGHVPDDDCVCGPTLEPVERQDGSIGWLHVHHPLAVEEAR